MVSISAAQYASAGRHSESAISTESSTSGCMVLEIITARNYIAVESIFFAIAYL